MDLLYGNEKENQRSKGNTVIAWRSSLRRLTPRVQPCHPLAFYLGCKHNHKLAGGESGFSSRLHDSADPFVTIQQVVREMTFETWLTTAHLLSQDQKIYVYSKPLLVDPLLKVMVTLFIGATAVVRSKHPDKTTHPHGPSLPLNPLFLSTR